MSRKSLLWLLAALSGIALTAAITWATSQLTSERIGLSSEPLSAAGRLAPSYVAINPATTPPSAKRTTRASKPARVAAPRSNAVSPSAPPPTAVTSPRPRSTSAQQPSGTAAPPLPPPSLRTVPAASGTRTGDDGQDHPSSATAGKREASGTPTPTGAGSGHSRDD